MVELARFRDIRVLDALIRLGVNDFHTGFRPFDTISRDYLNIDLPSDAGERFIAESISSKFSLDK